MTGTELQTLFTSINLGYTIDDNLFYSLLSTVQAKIEAKREWNILKKQDNSETSLTSDTFQTQKTIPVDFLFWQSEDPIVLVDNNNPSDFVTYKEVPFAKRFLYQYQVYRFFCDYAAGKLYFGGNTDRTYTIYKNYIYQAPAITPATSWVFPDKFHPILAYGVAALHKLGVDFDDINKFSGDDNAKTFNELLKLMDSWDSRLSVGMMEGVDRKIGDDLPGFISGHVNMFD